MANLKMVMDNFEKYKMSKNNSSFCSCYQPHDNGVYRIQHVLSHRSPHADDDNLHRRGDEGRAHRRDGLDDCLVFPHYTSSKSPT